MNCVVKTFLIFSTILFDLMISLKRIPLEGYDVILERQLISINVLANLAWNGTGLSNMTHFAVVVSFVTNWAIPPVVFALFI